MKKKLVKFVLFAALPCAVSSRVTPNSICEQRRFHICYTWKMYLKSKANLMMIHEWWFTRSPIINNSAHTIYPLKNAFRGCFVLFLVSDPRPLNFHHLLESVDLAPWWRFTQANTSLSGLLTCMELSWKACCNVSDTLTTSWGGFCPDGDGKEPFNTEAGKEKDEREVSFQGMQKWRWKKYVQQLEKLVAFFTFEVNRLLAAFT